MSQQINLFDPGFRGPRRVLSAAAMLVAVAAVIAGMGGYGYYARQRLVHAEAVLQQANREFKQLTDALARVGGEPQPAPSRALIGQIASAEARAGVRQALIDKLKGGGIGNTQGYSDYLTALARQRADGIWLTGITLAEGGSEFLIRGRAIRADLVPGYLALLNREATLRGRMISEMRLLEREQDPSTTVSPQPGAPASQPAVAGKADAAQGQPRMRFVEFTIGSGVTLAAGR